MGWLATSFASVMIVFLYLTFLMSSIIPKIQYALKHPGVGNLLATQVAVAVVFHLVYLLLLCSYLKAIIIAPGYIPRTEKWKFPFNYSSMHERKLISLITDLCSLEHHNRSDVQAFVKAFPVVERKAKNGQQRYCETCCLYKPDRSHHCRVCGTCVLRMDHHCPWLSNCMGFHNYKYFMLTLFYGIVAITFLLVQMRTRFMSCFRPILDTTYFVTFDLAVVVAYLICGVFSIVLSGFFMFHLYLVANSLTTIEMREKKANTNMAVRHRWKIANLKYDNGYYGNLLHVFGPVYMWLLPILPGDAGDGTYSTVDQTEVIDTSEAQSFTGKDALL
mmetsp:Transcript_42134/g.82766  ORF Transcript_42134/g.82766 Transcript_42134/m.82766 type:complete len:332 (-) Transcript_42134:146-1141(-)